MNNPVKQKSAPYLLMALLCFTSLLGQAQEEPVEGEGSADVFSGNYSDSFQEKFFDALQQKGIENYDKSINLLLECKQLDPEAIVVDHELAKSYLEMHQNQQALQYAEVALKGEPENEWYLQTWAESLLAMGTVPSALKEQLPVATDAIKEHLAQVLYRKGELDTALNVLTGIKLDVQGKILQQTLMDTLEKREQSASSGPNITLKQINEENPVNLLKYKLKQQLLLGEYTKLLQESTAAIEEYPAQPYFYYANGQALAKTGKLQDGAEVLEMGLDLILDDAPLQLQFYQALYEIQTQLGNSSKANQYLNKIKAGS